MYSSSLSSWRVSPCGSLESLDNPQSSVRHLMPCHMPSNSPVLPMVIL